MHYSLMGCSGDVIFRVCVKSPVLDLSLLGEGMGGKCSYNMFKEVCPYFFMYFCILKAIHLTIQGLLGFWYLSYIMVLI